MDTLGSTSKTQKWSTHPAKGTKKGMGRLNLGFPAGVHWSVDIYTNKNKFIINRSLEGKHKSYDMPPGFYNLKLNTVLIEKVSIESGKETNIRYGILDISSADWELRSEDNKKFLTSGNKSKKMIYL